MSYLLLTYNGLEQDVAYPEDEYPSIESAREAAHLLRAQYPHQCRTVREGWFSRISVVESCGDCWGHSLYSI